MAHPDRGNWVVVPTPGFEVTWREAVKGTYGIFELASTPEPCECLWEKWVVIDEVEKFIISVNWIDQQGVSHLEFIHWGFRFLPTLMTAYRNGRNPAEAVEFLADEGDIQEHKRRKENPIGWDMFIGPNPSCQ